jgi:Ca-activated chloride channel homolog
MAAAQRPELFEGFPIGEGSLIPTERALPPVPLEHTDIRAAIVGPICDVRVSQRFHNRHSAPIEAIYVFPLPEDAAVTELTLTLGAREIRGLVREREEARREYEQARAQGQGAALLEQSRPNLFSVAVANIQPDERVTVALRFHDRLVFDDGAYAFTLPTVVLPRYTPPERAAEAPPSPPLLPEASREGHTLAIEVALDAGKLAEIASLSHEIDVETRRGGQAVVRLRQSDAIPNKDFVLRYRPASVDAAGGPAASVFTVREAGKPGTLLLSLLPALEAAPEEVLPRELLFVFDRSGSMGGESIVQARNALRACLRALNPGDSFNIFPFDHEVERFRPASQPFTQASVDAADAYIDTIDARGGTEILGALKAALASPQVQGEAAERLRVVVFLTDGAVGNEEQVLRELRQSLGGTRVFAFGIGWAVNRFLLDKLASLGRGAVEYVLPGQAIEESVARFQSRAAFPLLRDLALDWGGAGVFDVYPRVLPDLYAGQPLELLARFRAAGDATLTLSGRTANGPFRQTLTLELPEATPDRSEAWRALPQVWARARIDDLLGEQRDDARRTAAVRDEVLSLALEHRLLSPYTSFVAVEERSDSHAEREAAQQIFVPIHLPQGTLREAFEARSGPMYRAAAAPMMLGGMPAPAAVPPSASARGGGGLLGKVAEAMFGGGQQSAPDAVLASAQPRMPAPVVPADTREHSSRERADAALRYLGRTQAVSGSWAESDEATALALLAFLRNGHSERAGSYRPQLRRAVAWLAAQAQRPDASPLVAWALAELRDGARPALAAPGAAGLDDEQALIALVVAAEDEPARGAAAGELLARQQSLGGDSDGAVIPAAAQSSPSALVFLATAAGALVWARG